MILFSVDGSGLALAQTVPPDPPPAATPVRAFVLVDESGSLSEADVERERQAASLLVASDLSAASEFAIYGFGSSNAPGQNAVEPYCELTRVDSEEARQFLADCAGSVHSRTDEEGPDTDHAAAIRAAVEKLAVRQPGDDRLGVVFLLTDGVLDVRNSESYGVDPLGRDDEASRELDSDILPNARSNGIQIWPLGFGDADPVALQRFAAGGAGANPLCPGRSAVPAGRVVGDSADVAFALLTALSSARCSVAEPPVVGTVGDKPLELKVRIPLIATDGSIAVTKVDPRIQVTYLDPDGKTVPSAGELDRQRFERSGAQGPVEALRIQNPKPGEWTVRLKGPEGSHQTVAASAIWQGAVRSVVSVSPVVPEPGQEAQVRVRLQTRDIVITDPSALRDLVFESIVTGDGFDELRVGLSDTGSEPDAKAQDGEYTGTFVLPSGATGKVSACGSVQGPGIVGDQRCAFADVHDVELVPRVDVDLRLPAELNRPAEVVGTVHVSSRVPAFEATVSLDDVSPDAEVMVEPSVLQVATGQAPHNFQIVVGPHTELGQLSGWVRVRDNEDRVIGEAFFLTEVTRPPGWWQRNRAVVLLVVAALAGLLVVALRVLSAREKRRRVTGLVASLHSVEKMVEPAVPAPVGRAKEFGVRFVAEPRSFEMCSVTAAGAVIVRRDTHGQVTIAGPGGQPEHTASFNLGGGYRIQIDDTRDVLVVPDPAVPRRRRFGGASPPPPPPPPVPVHDNLI